MFCVGAKIAFSDGRQAVARNSEEMSKIFGMKVVITRIVCHADSVTIDIRFSENDTTIGYRDLDAKEAYALDGVTPDEAKSIALHFMETGERTPEHNWSKVTWVDRV